MAAPRCHAHSKQTGLPCRQPAVRGREVCRFHGGHQPRGIASPRWKGRGYSKDLPTRLADRFRKAMRDPNLLACTSEVALLDSRIGEILGSLPESLSAVDRDGWDLLLPLLEQRRRLCEPNGGGSRRWTAISPCRGDELISALQMAVVEVVSDPVVRRRLAWRVEGLLGRCRARCAAGRAPMLADRLLRSFTRGLAGPETETPEEAAARAVVVTWTEPERHACLAALEAEAPRILAELAIRSPPADPANWCRLHETVQAMRSEERDTRLLMLYVLAQRRCAAAEGRPDPFSERGPEGAVRRAGATACRASHRKEARRPCSLAPERPLNAVLAALL